MKEVNYRDNCFENAFCVSLSDELRARLCKRCVKATYAANSSIKINPASMLLPLKGICCTEVSGRVLVIYMPGYLAATPTADSNSWRQLDTVSYGRVHAENMLQISRFIAVTDAEYALFSDDNLNDLLSIPEFSQALRTNWIKGIQSLLFYNMKVYRTNAYSAVKHIMELSRSYDIGRLTHMQIAYLTDLGRSTVTQAMNELIQAEPELFEGL